MLSYSYVLLSDIRSQELFFFYMLRKSPFSGALAIAVANPTDLVKVRLQSEGKLPKGAPRRYTGALNAYSTIVRQVGCL